MYVVTTLFYGWKVDTNAKVPLKLLHTISVSLAYSLSHSHSHACTQEVWLVSYVLQWEMLLCWRCMEDMWYAWIQLVGYVLPPFYMGVVWSDNLHTVWVTHCSMSHIVGMWWCSMIHTVWVMCCNKIHTVWLTWSAWSIVCELLVVAQFKLCEFWVDAWYILHYLCAWSLLYDVL